MESKDLKIKVIGIGGAVNNIVNSMNENKLDEVERSIVAQSPSS